MDICTKESQNMQNKISNLNTFFIFCNFEVYSIHNTYAVQKCNIQFLLVSMCILNYTKLITIYKLKCTMN